MTKFLASARYQFRPPWWALLGTLLLGGLLVTLGNWQYGRGRAKQALLDQHARALQQPARELSAAQLLPPAGQVLRVRVQGVYEPERGVLLDNQSHQRRPGLHVWTPLRLGDGSLLIVDRGWLPLQSAAPAPPPAGPQIVEGYWRALPQPGMRLGASGVDCAPTPARPLRVNFPDAAEARCLFGESLRPGLLELAPEEPGGYLRDWAPAGAEAVPPQRHYAYAAQWWAFAATLVGLFIKLNLRTRTAAPVHDRSP